MNININQNFKNKTKQISFQARSKLPKKRRRVLPVEQPRRKREQGPPARRTNAIKQQQHHAAHPPATLVASQPPIFKDPFGSAKIGKPCPIYPITELQENTQHIQKKQETKQKIYILNFTQLMKKEQSPRNQ